MYLVEENFNEIGLRLNDQDSYLFHLTRFWRPFIEENSIPCSTWYLTRRYFPSLFNSFQIILHLFMLA